MSKVEIRRKGIRAAVLMFSILCMLQICMQAVHVKAADNAVFHVQSSEVKEDGRIRVSVYMTDTDYMGGIDAELVYDPSQVTYVASGLGKTFTDGYGTTHCDEATSTVKCVAVYPEAKSAHGELMYAIFQLNGVSSYQPQFQVVDLLDASVEIQPIPYSITYQQADGSWADTQDTSGNVAQASVIADARKTYGADKDQEDSYETELATEEKSAEELLEEAEQAQKELDEEEKSQKIQAEDVTEDSAEKASEEDNDMKILVIVIAAVIVIVGLIFSVRHVKRRGKHNEE